MGIGNRIKEARERMGLTQSELGNLIGVTGSAITNYEKDISHPREQILCRLMEVLQVDANFLFQDAAAFPLHGQAVTSAEYGMIEKYRTLGDYDRETFQILLNRVYEQNRLHMGLQDAVLTSGDLEGLELGKLALEEESAGTKLA